MMDDQEIEFPPRIREVTHAQVQPTPCAPVEPRKFCSTLLRSPLTMTMSPVPSSPGSGPVSPVPPCPSVLRDLHSMPSAPPSTPALGMAKPLSFVDGGLEQLTSEACKAKMAGLGRETPLTPPLSPGLTPPCTPLTQTSSAGMTSNADSAEGEGKKKSPLDNRLRRANDSQCYSPATASIISASQGLAEDTLMVIADLITFVCRQQGGRAGRQRRGAVAEAPKTIEHVASWLHQQQSVLGMDIDDKPKTSRERARRSSSCPAPRPTGPTFLKGMRVQAKKDIKSNKKIVVAAATEGTVNYTIEDSKVNVTFDHRMDESSKPINVKVEIVEIMPDSPVQFIPCGFGDLDD